MYLTGNTIQEIFNSDNPNEGRLKINENFKRLGYLLDSAVYTSPSANRVLATQTYIDKEIPSGEVDGINSVFELSREPILGSDYVYLNGLLQENGDDLDYVLSGSSIVFSIPPFTGMRILCSYRI